MSVKEKDLGTSSFLSLLCFLGLPALWSKLSILQDKVFKFIIFKLLRRENEAVGIKPTLRKVGAGLPRPRQDGPIAERSRAKSTMGN